MNVVLIIPTGIGAEIGGHAGDGTPVARLMAATCDNLITHPNVVNASDINEMAENTLYVEGSMLNRFLEGKFCLKKVNYNKILCATNAAVKNEVVNSVSAARATLGADIEIMELKTPLRMIGRIEGNKATGDVYGWEELVKQVSSHDFDALAISSPIEVERETKLHYMRNGGINPYGAVEAIASKLIATEINKPVAHSPIDTTTLEDDKELFLFNEIVDPRLSAELVSVSYLHCILKGLHKAPQPFHSGLSVDDVDFLVTPVNCVGEPHKICMKEGIKIIAVKENATCLEDEMPDSFIVVDNYLEAAGMIMAQRAAIDHRSVRRPFAPTKIV